ncbi:MAG: hypothetical protein HYX60_10185 [Legionella longbeachae]|nr:hypothetical protein [Legionella longbeachae]
MVCRLFPNESKPHELKELLDYFNTYFELSTNTLIYDTTLTKKETECAYLLCLGLSAKTISCIMNLSMRTVESYIEQIKNKYLIEKKSLLPIKLVNSGIINLCKLKKIADELESTIIRQNRK